MKKTVTVCCTTVLKIRFKSCAIKKNRGSGRIIKAFSFNNEHKIDFRLCSLDGILAIVQ